MIDTSQLSVVLCHIQLQQLNRRVQARLEQPFRDRMVDNVWGVVVVDDGDGGDDDVEIYQNHLKFPFKSMRNRR